MALEELTKKIVDDAQEAAALVKAGADATITKLEHDAAKVRDEHRSAFARETAELLARAAQQAKDRAAYDARAVVESAQRTLLDRVFVRALDELVAQSGDAYSALLRKSLARIAESNDTIEVVYAPREHLAETKAAVHDARISAPVEVREDVRGGFVAVGPACEYDARFEELLKHIQRTHEPEIARILFGA
jgi:vacuolar-type H+-ATPase subunit E/Vma4